jgi:transcriptional regulator with GAF, ATPase, and Fis domain
VLNKAAPRGDLSVVNPRLLAISGPLRDSTFVLSGSEIPVGRDSSNSLTISDPALSRRHCIITREENGYKIRDLNSRNGTFVNGVAVQESVLQHGDQISIGDSSFSLLLMDDAEEPVIGQVEFEDRVTQATAKLRPQDVLYLQPDRILNELPSSSRLGRNLNALLKISRAVHSIRDLEQLQARILELIFEVTPAERGAILLDSKGKGEFNSVFARHRPSIPAQAMHVSRTVTQQVIEEGLAILGADVAGSDNLRGVESLASSSIRSLLCVPLAASGKVTGCIYLDTTNPAGRFDENHLQLAAAAAGISAAALENARRLQWLEQENLRLNTEINLEHNMVGESARMREVYQFLSRVAPKDTTVLIEGESGTGKELAARAIHRNSPRSGKPFVAINCAAIPEGLLESELFGHERGAFTDAVTQKRGRLEVANGGVVFLDEIGELAPALQVKLLRVLQEREFERVGGTRPISVDIRLIAATNKNLEEAVKTGLFRLDLYYRLNVVTLVMPPLRERREDIPVLAGYFVRKYSKKCKVKLKEFSPDAMQCLVSYDWPGNVRELENAVERALVFNTSDTIQPEDLPESLLEKDPPLAIAAAKYHATIKETKKQLILNALSESKGNYTEAAHLLGVHPNYLHRLIRNLGLKDTIRASLDSRTATGKLSNALT